MKRILMFLVIIGMLTSTAIATPSGLWGCTFKCSPTQPISGQPTTVMAVFSGDKPFTGTCYITEYDPYGNNIVYGHVPIINGVATLNGLVLTRGVHVFSVSYGGGDYVASGGSQIINVIDPASIPEFPTIAAPVVALLGLMVIIGRKKV